MFAKTEAGRLGVGIKRSSTHARTSVSVLFHPLTQQPQLPQLPQLRQPRQLQRRLRQRQHPEEKKKKRKRRKKKSHQRVTRRRYMETSLQWTLGVSLTATIVPPTAHPAIASAIKWNGETKWLKNSKFLLEK